MADALTDDEVLSNEEVRALVLSALRYHAERGASREELDQVLAWATQARVDASLLRLVLAGRVLVGVHESEVVFRAPEP